MSTTRSHPAWTGPADPADGAVGPWWDETRAAGLTRTVAVAELAHLHHSADPAWRDVLYSWDTTTVWVPPAGFLSSDTGYHTDHDCLLLGRVRARQTTLADAAATTRPCQACSRIPGTSARGPAHSQVLVAARALERAADSDRDGTHAGLTRTAWTAILAAQTLGAIIHPDGGPALGAALAAAGAPPRILAAASDALAVLAGDAAALLDQLCARHAPELAETTAAILAVSSPVPATRRALLAELDPTGPDPDDHDPDDSDDLEITRGPRCAPPQAPTRTGRAASAREISAADLVTSASVLPAREAPTDWLRTLSHEPWSAALTSDALDAARRLLAAQATPATAVHARAIQAGPITRAWLAPLAARLAAPIDPDTHPDPDHAGPPCTGSWVLELDAHGHLDGLHRLGQWAWPSERTTRADLVEIAARADARATRDVARSLLGDGTGLDDALDAAIHLTRP